MTKKLVCLLLAAMMIATLAACGGAAPAQESSRAVAEELPTASADDGKKLPVLSPDDPTTFTVFVPTAKPAPSSDNKIAKRLKDELGVTLELDIISSNYDEKIGVMIAAGEYPDIIGNSSQHARFIEAGALIPFNDYLTPGLAGNILTHVEPFLNRLSYPADGKIYVLPNYNRYYGEISAGTHWGPAFWIQKAVVEEFGYPEINDLETYFGLIEQYKAKYPTIDGQPTIGFEICAAPGKEFCLTNAPQHLIGHPNDGGVVVDVETKVADIFADKEYAKTYYKTLNEMNKKGLVDPETFTQNYDQYLAKLASGRVLGMFDQRWNFGNAYDALTAEGRYERQWIPVMPVYDGYEPYYRDRDVMNINQGYGVSVNCKEPDKAVAFLNTILEEDWQILFSWGVEGEDYLVNDAGRYYRTPEMRTTQDDPVWKTKNKYEAFWDMMPKKQGQFSNGNNYDVDGQPEEFFDTLKDYDKKILQGYGKQTWVQFLNQPPENPPYYPAWNIPLVDGSDAQMANTQLNDLALQYLPKAILSSPSEFDAIWSEYTAKIQETNYKAYLEVINKEIAWRMENWG